MKQIGLFPSNTGLPGGAQTGVQMTHYVMRGHAFDVWCYALLDSGFTMPYRDAWAAKVSTPPATIIGPVIGTPPLGKGLLVPVKPKVKTKWAYTCGGCGDKVWGKPDLWIKCGMCDEDMTCEPTGQF